MAPPAGNPAAPHTEWKKWEFVMNHEGLEQMSKGGGRERRGVRVEVAEIVSVSPCSDLTLPPGAGLCIHTIHGSVFLVN